MRTLSSSFLGLSLILKTYLAKQSVLYCLSQCAQFDRTLLNLSYLILIKLVLYPPRRSLLCWGSSIEDGG